MNLKLLSICILLKLNNLNKGINFCNFVLNKKMNPKQGSITLDEFIIQRQKEFRYANGDLSRLLRDIGFAAKSVRN